MFLLGFVFDFMKRGVGRGDCFLISVLGVLGGADKVLLVFIIEFKKRSLDLKKFILIDSY